MAASSSRCNRGTLTPPGPRVQAFKAVAIEYDRLIDGFLFYPQLASKVIQCTPCVSARAYPLAFHCLSIGFHWPPLSLSLSVWAHMNAAVLGCRWDTRGTARRCSSCLTCSRTSCTASTRPSGYSRRAM